MQPPVFPAEVVQRLAQLADAQLALVYEPDALRPRATLWFAPPVGAFAPALSVTVAGLHDASWELRTTPTLRVTWRYARAVADVRFGTVQSFTHAPGSPARVRVEVVLEDGSRVALEGDDVTIGPIARPAMMGAQGLPGAQGTPTPPHLLN